ncbi:MAG: hypothetical protein L0Z70_14415, partial [Chloroflexi bacterium]|nr:hypothetical protein [Chloroflexota bacterium]
EEERYQVALAKAAIDAQAGAARRSLLEQELEFAAREAEMRFREALELGRLDVAREAMKALIQVSLAGYTLPAGVSGSLPPSDLSAMFHAIFGGRPLGAGPGSPQADAPNGLYASLVQEAEDAAIQLEEASWRSAKLYEGGALRLEFLVLGRYGIVLECGLHYPVTPPRVYQKRGSKLVLLMALDWNSEMRLVDALEQIIRHFEDGGAPGAEARGDGGRKDAHDSANPMGRSN